MSLRRWSKLDLTALGAIVAVALLATWAVWVEVFAFALYSEEQSHILLAVPVAMWLFWLRRSRLRVCAPNWSYFGPIAVAAGWAVSALGFTRGVDIFRHAGALIMVMGAILSVVGPNVMLRFLPAIGALIFLFPVPGRIRTPVARELQEVSAVVASHGMEWLGFEVMRSGNALLINNVEVAVAEACNGMRMVSALALVSYAFVFSVPMRQSVRLFIILLSPIVALAVNVLRLVPTVLFYGYADISVAEAFHDLSGWASLLVALGLLAATLKGLRWLELPIAPVEVQDS